ncbi:PAS domain-containing hybrid sensor histidine kinase/response regulator [Novosphingobium mangrovi (ex Huang et al. 2023)]|uniref:histidine kinase n=1 Tax=Novosphingobium mangrovi (ex Huang et al. 2023) TaxID=2976432 RepID=A0ABT2IAN0_9SPHN|nr:PAS domain-containing hybrid sensor histidine kinase/response regulator [Novosphingobium mangrovi (ex Huang et al. 2023)]MCT2401562.1 PAS domain-containing hybrid sensor histidine kinase/response regulator [Novosphingobium mangrovi (ex Huang et al. 2023)]
MPLRSSTILALALIVILFAIAATVESRRPAFDRRPRLRQWAYTLALGVYCSSWTFYGAVGTAAREGWNYLPIYAAPILLLLAAPRFLSRLTKAVAAEKAVTVSDFIAARFGHDIVVARLVTVTALLGTIPYIALQLRSIGSAMSIVSARPVTEPVMMVAALLLALFAILFGARRYELAGRAEGLVYAIGLDSLFKLLALGAVAALACVLLLNAEPGSVARGWDIVGERFGPGHLSMEFAVITLISAMAIIALPRQFYMALVEAREPEDLVRARFGLAGYVGLMAVLVLPIALAGSALLPASVGPDRYVLQLPESGGSTFVLAAALLGGVGAAASMAIIEATALATMVSNDLVFPSVFESGLSRQSGKMGRRMLGVRRMAIFAIMALALIWALLVSSENSLASIGLIAFAAMAQFTPHLLFATYGVGRDHIAARASLATGMALWLYTLALPPILPPDWLAALAGTPFDPLRLLGIGKATPLVHGVFWSLGCNLAVYGLVAARGIKAPVLPGFKRGRHRVTDLADLVALTASFVGEERAREEFPEAREGMALDRASARRAEDLIARVVGASSARALIASALEGGTMPLPDVARLIDEGGRSLRFSQKLLAATFENLDAGISVIDADLNLIAWNSRYEALFDYPPGMLRIGAPIAELIRYNVLHGDFGGGDPEHHVEKRLDHFRRGSEYSFERLRRDGRVIKTTGGPMPGGGYVTSFTDITEDARVREELRRTLENLEQRVAERTRELSEANRRLAKADRDKTRFLAAASHDLLQPLHAARLFTAALERDVAAGERPLVERVENAIAAAEDLLRALLDISKLDAGGVEARPEPLVLGPFLTDLAEGFRPMAESKGLELRLGAMPGRVHTDPGLLRSVIQNFLANAVRYSERGGVLLGVRRRGEGVRIDVVDTGVGVDPEHIETIFDEFTRLGTVEAEGLGLGLALSERIARLLGGTISVHSVPGKGSRFSLYLPAIPDVADTGEGVSAPTPARAMPSSLDVLVVDNDPRIVEASIALLERLGHRAVGAASIAEALPYSRKVDAVLADYRLDNGEDGISLISAMRAEAPGLAAVIISAEDGPEVREQAAAIGVNVLAKPASAANIEAFLAGLSVLQVEP